jgi:hypothetical protein
MKARHAARAAAAMLAVVGVTFISPSSSPSAAARLASSPTAASVGVASDYPGVRKTVTEKGVRFSFKVPTKRRWEPSWWERHYTDRSKTSPKGPISLNKSLVGPQGAEAIIYWTSFPDGDYADPCAHLLGRSIVGSAADLATAVAAAPGAKLVEGPSDVTLGGRPAKRVVLKVRKNVGCDPGFFYTWRTGWGGAFWRTTDVGDTIRVWIVPVDGTRLFIAAATSWQIHAALEKEIQQIIESIRFP